MARNVTAPQRARVRPLEDVATELARLTAQMRQMASANRALRGTNETLTAANETLTAANETLTAANETLTAANTGLRHDRADAQAETAHAHADTADIRTRNVALQATNDAIDSRNADLEATVAEVERANGALQAHRVGVQGLAAVLEAERAQFAVILAGLEDAVLVVDQAGTPLRRNAAYVHLFGEAVVAPDDARGRPLAPDQTPQARAARGETFSLSFSLATGAPSLTGEDTRRWFVATGQPLQEGSATHAIVVIRDVTLSNRHRRLQEEFLTLAGHELRTPLTSVKGYLVGCRGRASGGDAVLERRAQPHQGRRGDRRADGGVLHRALPRAPRPHRLRRRRWGLPRARRPRPPGAGLHTVHQHLGLGYLSFPGAAPGAARATGGERPGAVPPRRRP